MADRLRSAIAFGYIAILGCAAAGNDTHEPALSNAAGLGSDMRVAARALGRYYDVANDGAREAFAARAQTQGVAAGRSERCRLPDGRLSTRPTVLANPLLPASSIRQRTALFAAIGAYEVALAARASGADRSVVIDVDRDLHDRLVAIDGIANTHAQGDLFIEDLALSLRQMIERAGLEKRAVPRPDIGATESIARKLLDVLATDVARQRVDTIDAAALAYRGWALDANHLRSAHAYGRASTNPPFCSEPAIYERAQAVPQASFVATLPQGRMRVRASRAQGRFDAVRSADPRRVMNALAMLDAALAREFAPSAKGESVAGRAEAGTAMATSIERFRDEARAFANAMNGVR